MSDDIAFRDSRGNDESFIICSKVTAYDHHSAREGAESLLGQISGVFNFFHHKKRPEISEKAVISRTYDNYVVILDKPTKFILKVKLEQSPSDAANSVRETLSGLQLDKESTYRFARWIDLHSAALTATAIENQLLDLWAALETLMPKSYESNKDRIVQICDSLVPFLQLNYIQKQLIELLSDLRNWSEPKLKEIFDKIPDSGTYTDLEKIGALVAINSNSVLREELYSSMADFPLLKNRIYTLHETLNSPEAIKKMLDNHKIKIEWHLRRIYRTRGLIIHSGTVPSYTSVLIENLHNYFDIFLKKIITLSKDSKIVTIEQGILEVQLLVEYQYSLLKKHQNENLTGDNFKEALLGENYS